MSIAEPSSLAHLGLGSSLATARLSRGLALADAEQETRIRARYLAALEEEEFEALPGDAYAVAFLRSYAAYLGLDADVYAAEYRRRRVTPAERIGAVLTRLPRRRRPRRAWPTLRRSGSA